ncbi:unnamed protein product [Rotaria magnacalcarata]|uniref:Peptidase C14 caspase domain-containing protein n=3 Tax=Rotaria magnacalcarata TaxID=392030 RepID=A0A816GTK5_9BILA|nr:unnamed protein product [Rotaria magnacalcarata]CAF4416913.1 unnamed protein product [Rotaria magnacalcarata]
MATRSKVNVMSQPLRKLALVIGIGDYESGEKLNNTQKDARDMSLKLDRMGFISDGPKLDLTCKEMETALVNFKYSIREGDIVLFYFAGHGTQWEDQNFLIPKDDDRMDADEIKNRAILIQKFLDDFNDRHPFLTILLLDCCRVYHLRNPKLNVALARAKKINNSQSTGLKQMDGKAGTLIAFACTPGTIAQDGTNEQNGLFTKYLLEHIATPNKDIRMIMAAVTRGVMTESKLNQRPSVSLTLWDEYICLFEQSAGKG